MISNRSFAELLQLTSEVLQESRKLRVRARETLAQTDVVIGQSRRLLSLWPVEGTPALHNKVPGKAEEAASEAPHHVPRPSPVSEEAVLEQIVEQNFCEAVVRLDGRHFVDCKVENCTLEYHGGPVILEGTHFTGCRFRFGGEAATTVSLLECFDLIGAQNAECARLPARPSGTTHVN